MRRSMILYVVFILILFQDIWLWETVRSQSQNVEQKNNVYKMTVDVRVYDLDLKDLYSSVEVFLRLGPLPVGFNESGILVQILGGGDAMVFCNDTSSDHYGKYFQGNFSKSWYITGEGEQFPFDQYKMQFKIRPLIDCNFTIDEVTAIFSGAKQKQLSEAWETKNAHNEIPFQIAESDELMLTIQLKRRSLIPFLTLVLPVILCYYLLGATLYLEPSSRMQEILTVYISLFVFVPTFFIGIQDFLPYRSLLTIPEFLLTYAIVTNAFFGVSIMTSEHVRELKICNKKFHPSEWFGLILSSAIFIPLYWFLFFPISMRSPSSESIVTFLLVIGSYFFGLVGFVHRLKKRRSNGSSCYYE